MQIAHRNLQGPTSNLVVAPMWPDLVYFLPDPVGLKIPPCFKDLQHLEQEGVIPPNLGSFDKKMHNIWSH